jgi:hypothetical protein
MLDTLTVRYVPELGPDLINPGATAMSSAGSVAAPCHQNGRV